MDYERVTLDMIGRGGTSDDIPLADQINEAIQAVAEAVSDLRRHGKGSVTIKISVERMGDEGDAVLFAGEVKATMPTRRTKALSALIDETGAAVAASHKQQPLDLDDGVVTRLARKGGEA